MIALLNPRVWLVVMLLAALGVSHGFMYRKGKANVRTEWLAATAMANEEARRLERARQSRADDAGRAAAAREVRILADAASAAAIGRRLRDAIAQRDAIRQSGAAEVVRADTYGRLFLESAEALRGLAQTCDGHVNDLRMLLEAWPTDSPRP